LADPRSIVWIDKFGTALAVYDAVAIPACVPGSLLMGADGGTARRIVVDAVGRVVSVGIGVAGVPAGGVMSVQGVAGGLPMPISGTVTLGASTVLADQGAPALTALAWPTMVTDGVDSVGVSTVGLQKALKVDVIQTVGGGSGGTSSLFGVAFPLSGTAGGFFDGVNMQGARVYDTDSGAGAEYTLGVNLRLSAGGGSVEAGTNANPIQVGDAGGSLTTDTAQLPAALVGGRLDVDGSAVTQPVSAAALPLPAGAATEATLGARAAAVQLPGALVGGRLDINVGSWLGLTSPSVGQKTMASSIPIAIASNQSAIPVTDNAGSLTVDSAQLPTVLGAQANSGSLSIVFGTGTNFVGTPGGAVPAQAAFIAGRDGAGATIQVPGVYDLNTAAGIDWVLGANLRKATAAGSVELGTATDPIRTDPTGTTTQPVGDAGGSLTVDTPQLPVALAGGRLDVNIGAQSAPVGVSGTVTVTDGGASLTVDTTQLPTLLGRTTAAASLSVTLSSDDDFVGDVAIAVPGKAAFIAGRDTGGGTLQAPGVFDMNTGAGVDWVFGVNLRKATAAGSVEFGTSTDPIRTDPTGTTTQPVSDAGGSLTVDAPVGTPLFARLSDGAAALIGQKAMAASLPVVMASDQSAIPVTLPTLTKGTQGATGASVQALKDAGRARVVISFEAVAPAVGDTLLTLVKKTNGVAAAGATTIPVTAGKTLRIMSVSYSIKAGAAAAAFGTLSLRENPAGAVVIGSPTWGRIDVGNTAAVIGGAASQVVTFPDGMEFSGANQIGASIAAQAVTNVVSVEMYGFEY
jgi:hypothetical protein